MSSTDLKKVNTVSEGAGKDDGLSVENVWPAVGDRVSCSGDIGTVRYVGEVTGTSGSWVGVEWDDPTRGRHNGCVNGTQYFITNNAKGGSFVREGKLSRPVSCSSAVLERYGSVRDADTVVDQPQLASLERDVNARFVRVIGMDKVSAQQGRLTALTEVYLRGCCLIGDRPARLNSLCGNIRDLDISENLFSSWKHVAEIVVQLPRLRQLNVSGNRLPDPEPELKAVFGEMKAVFLNRMLYCWSLVEQCAEMWPQLQALTLLSNRISEIPRPPSPCLFEHLEFLDLEDNPINEWSYVLHLAQLPALLELSLINTGLKTIYFSGDCQTQTAGQFCHLQSLLLCRNQIDDWESINALHRLPKLSRLKFTGNPLNSTASGDDVRGQLVARIGKLVVLNKSEVTREERRWAELDYLRQYGGEWRQADHPVSTKGGPETAVTNTVNAHTDQIWRSFVRKHPRYTELCERWGAPELSELRPAARTIGDTLVNVELVRGDGAADWRRKRQLPVSMSVARLRVVINKMLRGDLSRLQLSCCSPEQPNWHVDMNVDRDLNFYGVEDGYSIMARYD